LLKKQKWDHTEYHLHYYQTMDWCLKTVGIFLKLGSIELEQLDLEEKIFHIILNIHTGTVKLLVLLKDWSLKPSSLPKAEVIGVWIFWLRLHFYSKKFDSCSCSSQNINSNSPVGKLHKLQKKLDKIISSSLKFYKSICKIFVLFNDYFEIKNFSFWIIVLNKTIFTEKIL